MTPSNSQTIRTHRIQYLTTAMYWLQLWLMGNEDDNSNETCCIEFLITYMSTCVIECKSISSCSSSGLVAGLLITGLHIQLALTTFLWNIMPVRRYQNNIQELVLYKRLCTFIAKIVSPAPVSVWILVFYHPEASYPGLGSWPIVFSLM